MRLIQVRVKHCFQELGTEALLIGNIGVRAGNSIMYLVIIYGIPLPSKPRSESPLRGELVRQPPPLLAHTEYRYGRCRACYQ